jgi:hypothetical protein
MRGRFQRFGWLVLPGLLVACREPGVSVNVPGEAVAVGALLPLSVSDDCQGGGKLSFCSADSLVSVDSFKVDDERVATLLRMEELNEGLRTSDALVIAARASGSTALSIEATFDDGSVRTFDGKVSVKRADRMTLSHRCTASEPDDLNLFPVGAEVSLSAQLLAGTEELQGEHQKDLLEGAGITRRQGFLKDNNYAWTVPEAGDFMFTSPIFGEVAGSYRGYDLASLSIASVRRKYEGPTRYKTFIAFDAELSVDGKRPCKLPPVTVDVLTPTICDGHDGVTTWVTDDPAYGLSVRALQSGTCEFTVSVTGTETSFAVQTEIEATEVPIPVVDPCEGVSCETAPASCVEGSELAKQACCVECVPVPDAAECEVERVTWDELYESQLAAATACNVDADCAPVVLTTGCRNYCYVALNTEQTVAFMNAISEKYYTSCPACRVDNAVPPCGGDGRTYCKSGTCSMLRP